MKNKDKNRLKKMTREEIISLYSTYIPHATEKIVKTETDGKNKDKIILFIENKGIMNTIMQKLIKKPRFSQIHLDDTGSFIWSLCDGQNNIGFIADRVHEYFGEKADPLYERLLRFFEIMESYGFISYYKPGEKS